MSRLIAGRIKPGLGEDDTIKVEGNLEVQGDLEVTGGLVRDYRNGEVIEVISGLADGRTIASFSGAYTLQNVVASQSVSDTATEVTGSAITYQAPAGTRTVEYEFIFHWGDTVTSGAMYHMALEIDGVEVSVSRQTEIQRSGYDWPTCSIFRFPITVGSVNDIASGIVNGWTTPRTLKVVARRYGSTYPAIFHQLIFWDGANSAQITQPRLKITAIA